MSVWRGAKGMMSRKVNVVEVLRRRCGVSGWNEVLAGSAGLRLAIKQKGQD